MSYMFDLLLLAMGAYVLFAGVTGKGKLYATENVKKGMEEAFRKAMRKIYLALGIVMVLNSVFSLLMSWLYTAQLTEATDTAAATVEYVLNVADLGFWSFLTPTVLMTLTYVCMGLIVALIVLMVIKLRKFTDRKAPQAASAQQGRQAGHILPVDAFEFDEPEEPAVTDADAGEVENDVPRAD